MTSVPPLTHSSTLEELLLLEAQVTPDSLGSEIFQQLKQHQDWPGMLVIDQNDMLMGAVLRRHIFHHLGQPPATDLFFKQPIYLFLDSNPDCCLPLVLSYQEKVGFAVKQGLGRSSAKRSDPIVVEYQHPQLPDLHSYFLLDWSTLLLAHSQILQGVNQQVRQQSRITERQATQLYSQKIEENEAALLSQYQLLEQQQQQLLAQAEEIQLLHQRFRYIGQFLSREGEKAFQSTFAGINVICQNTNQITSIGQLLTAELATIDSTSVLIEQVSRQVRQLSIQASIAINKQDGVQTTGFSYIVEEIGQFMNQTREAGRQMRLLTSRFRERVDTFTEAAQSVTAAARSLILEINQASNAFSTLERLVQEDDLELLKTLSMQQTTPQLEEEILQQQLNGTMMGVMEHE